MRVVEIRVARVALADTLEIIHEWLDSNRCGPMRVETVGKSGIVTVKVKLDADSQAELFRQSFRGEHGMSDQDTGREPARNIG